MNKSELIDAMASNAKLTKADTKKALDAMFEAIKEALKNGDSVTIQKVGSFKVAKRSERTGRNPQTGKSITIAPKNVVKFKCGSCPPPGFH
ncbi:MAG TPA: DNA-binding protein [Bacteroidales bacterium]|nr:DNA-binding protein [Bacteroidales bacterium]